MQYATRVQVPIYTCTCTIMDYGYMQLTSNTNNATKSEMCNYLYYTKHTVAELQAVYVLIN